MPPAERRAAVITGRGAICALGDRAATFWESLLAGTAAILFGVTEIVVTFGVTWRLHDGLLEGDNGVFETAHDV